MLSASRHFAAALVLCLVIPASAFSATILGRVTDTATDKPVVFATVKLLELSKSVHTDADGNYVFDDIPAGRYTITISTEGTTEHALGMVEASDEASVTLNAALQPDGTPVTDGDSDENSPMITRSGEDSRLNGPIRIGDMPIRGYADYFAIQPSTVRRSYGAPLHVRGGRIEEFSYMVDGFSTQDPFTGRAFTALNGNVAEEIEFNPGYNDPSEGWLASGQAEVETRETWSTSGSIEAITDNFHGEKSDFSLYAGDLSGSLIPNRPGQLTYLIDGEMRTIGNRDVGGPNDWNYLGAWHGKLNWRPRDGSTLMLGTRGSYEDWKYTPREYVFDAVHAPRGIDENYAVFGTWEQEIAHNTDIEASANWFSAKHRQGDGVHFDDIWAYGRPSGNPRFDQTTLFWSWDDILLDDRFDGPIPPPLHTPVVESTFTVTLPAGEQVEKSFIIRGDEGSVWDDYFEQAGSYIGGKFEIEHKHSESTETELGIEFQRHTVRAYRDLFPTLIYQGNNGGGFVDIDRYGYDESGNEIDEEGTNGAKHPLFLAGYANQHIGYQELSFDIGLRWDHMYYDAMRLVDPTQPLDPYDLSTYADTASGLTQQVRDSLRQTTQRLDENELVNADALDRLSPRMRVSFAIDERNTIFLSLGRYVQRPALGDLYVDYRYLEYKVQTGGYYYAFGNSALEPASTIMYEAGWESKLSKIFGLNIIGFYKDITKWSAARTQPAIPNSFTIVQNIDDATVKGAEVNLTLARTSGFAGAIGYSYTDASGHVSLANTQSNIAWTVAEPPRHNIDFGQRHRITAVADFQSGPSDGPQIGDWHPLGNAGLCVLADIGAGFPYSPVDVYNEVTLGAISPRPIGPLNSEYTDWTFRIDLKAKKSIPVFSADLEVYLWVINLFDRENVVDVYNGTGEPDNTGWLETVEGQQFVTDNGTIHDSSFLTGEQKYELRQNDPANLDIPRQIRFGVRVAF